VDEGAYSPTGRWLVRFADGGTAFVKAEAEPRGHYGVAVEQLVYSAVASPALPRLVGYDAGPPAVLVTEDLSYARWGTPLTVEDATALRTALDLLRDVPAPEGLRPVPFSPPWTAFDDDPAPLLASGLVADPAWAAAYVPVLRSAAAGADPAGDRLVHLDLWLQNWCRVDGRGAVLVDWAGSAHGDPLVMRAWGEAGVRAAGGPPGVVLSGRPEWAAWAAGLTAAFLAEEQPDAHPRLLETERREAVATLRWACDELGLPYPEPGPACAALGPWRP
jgi:hypothetical protein